jgi:type II secretory pathway component PulF
MSRYVSPVNPAVFPHLTLVLMSIGLFFTAWFFVYPLMTMLFGCIYCRCNGSVDKILHQFLSSS